MKSRQTTKKIILLAIITILSIAGLTGCGNEGADNQTGELGQKYGPIFESFSTTDIYGGPQDESLILGSRYTLVLIWSTTCNPCIEGMPKMEALYQEYKDIGINVLGIVVNVQDQEGNPVSQTMADAVSIAKAKGVTFTNTMIPAPVMSFLYEEIQYTPTAFFVDQTGTIVSELYIGEREYDDWSESIEELLE